MARSGAWCTGSVAGAILLVACGGSEVGSRRETADGGSGGRRATGGARASDAGLADAHDPGRPDASAGGADAGAVTDAADADALADAPSPADADAAPPVAVAPRWLVYADGDGDGDALRLMGVLPADPPIGPVQIAVLSPPPQSPCARWSPDGARLYYTLGDYIRGTTGWIVDATPSGFVGARTIGSAPCEVTWSPDSRWLAVPGSGVAIWDAASPGAAPVASHLDGAVEAAWSSDSRFLALRGPAASQAGAQAGPLTVLDFYAGHTGDVLPTPPLQVTSLWWSPGGARLVVARYLDEPVLLHVGDDPSRVVALERTPGWSTFLGWSPLGHDALLGSGLPPDTLYLGAPGGGAPRLLSTGGAASPESVAPPVWAPDGRHFLTRGDAEARAWDLKGVSRQLPPGDHRFCPTGERLGSSEPDSSPTRFVVRAASGSAQEVIELGPGLEIAYALFSDPCTSVMLRGVGNSPIAYGTWASRLGGGALQPISSTCPDPQSFVPGEDRLLCLASDPTGVRLQIVAPVAGAEPLVLATSRAGILEPTWQPGSPPRDRVPPTFLGCDSDPSARPGDAEITWSPAVDDRTAPEDVTYEVTVWRDGSAPADGVVAHTRGQGRVTVLGLEPATTYRVACHATDESGNRDLGASVQVFTTPPAGAPPSFAGASAVSASGLGATLSWLPATDDRSPPSGIDYLVYAAAVPGGQTFAVPLAVSAPGATSLVVGNLATDSDHHFVVRARDGDGNVDGNRVEVSLHVPVSFRFDVEPMLAGACAFVSCHSGADPSVPPQQGLRLDATYSYENLVDVLAIHRPEGQPIYRVSATDPDPSASYLWRKLSGCCPILGQGPQDPMHDLPVDARETIRRWIVEGASAE